MEHVSSRKNQAITHLKALSSDIAYRYENSEYLCEGEKMLREALSCEADIAKVLWCEKPSFPLDKDIKQYTCPPELLQYASPLKSSRGPLFSVHMNKFKVEHVKSALILENVQDPGNVGTVIRTADAMGIDVVVLTGNCADVYNFKTVRSTMGAIFRQRIVLADIPKIRDLTKNNGLKLYCAALSDTALNIRSVNLHNSAVAIGSEGAGLSDEILSACDGQIIIPMKGQSESLNAAVAASIIMWEMAKNIAGEDK